MTIGPPAIWTGDEENRPPSCYFSAQDRERLDHEALDHEGSAMKQLWGRLAGFDGGKFFERYVNARESGALAWQDGAVAPKDGAFDGHPADELALINYEGLPDV
jgi:hypothetical protein